MSENFVEIKAIIVGSSGVGKTNLINVCAGQRFNEESLIVVLFFKKI